MHSSLDELARSTSVVINCAGPFAVTGEPVIGACIRHGAHYLDLTGEWPYWDTIVRKYDAAARKAGVAVVPACGLDCIPSDLAVFHALSSGPSGVVSDASSVEFFFDMDVKPSAGTVKSCAIARLLTVKLTGLLQHHWHYQVAVAEQQFGHACRVVRPPFAVVHQGRRPEVRSFCCFSFF